MDRPDAVGRGGRSRRARRSATGPSVAGVPSARTTSTRPDVIDGLAVAERPGAGRVVADHPADRGPVAGRDVGPEHQAQRLQVGVELVEHDARLDPDGHRVAIDDADPVQVLREIKDCQNEMDVTPAA